MCKAASANPQRVEDLNKIVKRRIHHGAATRLNFNIRTINAVYENRASLVEYMHEIEEQFTNKAVCSAAASIRRTLNDPIFNFWLTFFYHVMPHVDILFHQLQQREIEPTLVKDAIDNFERSITQVRNNIDSITTKALDIIRDQPPGNKRKRSIKDLKVKEVEEKVNEDEIETSETDNEKDNDSSLKNKHLSPENFPPSKRTRRKNKHN
ncbi:unnamed protein product [Psylliodes chrysocephalus]|uniref:Uncharacterized protein n=1 Tax=Psylliodes chrysocephalus TaxID=3402493 RepID=A0A9P0CNA0_9CUCU|nr:unnamed protein product [Psylliodes chrysocephala]